MIQSDNEIDIYHTYNDKRAVKKVYKYAYIEAKMLDYLRQYINTPKVYHSKDDLLIMEYINGDFNIDEEAAGLSLAKLHNVSSDYFGFDYDTTIGGYLQENAKNKSWVEFFINQRVLYMAKECYIEEKIDKELLKTIEKLCLKLDDILSHNPKPSLIHGDVWCGNIIQSQELYFIDPAIYFADFEIELAFIMMFETFSHRFFDRYKEIKHIDKEFFKTRYKIYQIYPYLVHIRKFQGGYVNGLKNILNYFV